MVSIKLFFTDDGEEEEENEFAMDAYEMATAVNVIGKLPADFYDKLVSI